MSNLTAVFIFFPIPIFTDIHLFVFALAYAELSNLSFQVSINQQPAQSQVVGTLVQTEGWARLGCKYHYEMETSTINIYHMLIIRDQILWETENGEIWT